LILRRDRARERGGDRGRRLGVFNPRVAADLNALGSTLDLVQGSGPALCVRADRPSGHRDQPHRRFALLSEARPRRMR